MSYAFHFKYALELTAFSYVSQIKAFVHCLLRIHSLSGSRLRHRKVELCPLVVPESDGSILMISVSQHITLAHGFHRMVNVWVLHDFRLSSHKKQIMIWSFFQNDTDLKETFRYAAIYTVPTY